MAASGPDAPQRPGPAKVRVPSWDDPPMIVPRVLTQLEPGRAALSPPEAAKMAQNLATLIGPVNEAQRRLRDTTPKTAEWRDAQRVAVYARADYWQAMGLEWDLNHGKATTVAEVGDSHSA